MEYIMLLLSALMGIMLSHAVSCHLLHSAKQLVVEGQH